ncbi:MAG TPA: MBL fold metallo-hydrolase [Candidatus Kapabacteria bacterium]|nr:MBL fold metallo-hydrolase [Candidatus Kapabacteria bacterium]
MQVSIYNGDPNIYTAKSYFVRGSWNAIADINTLIDTGRDDGIVDYIHHLNTGLGKKKLDLVILTHEHFDHTNSLKVIKPEFSPYVIGMAKGPLVDEIPKDGMKVKIGDCNAEILYTPGHSNDSICIYVPENGTLFSGDTQLSIKTIGGTYTKAYIETLKRLSYLDLKIVYSGHDAPIVGNIADIIAESMNNVLRSSIVD